MCLIHILRGVLATHNVLRQVAARIFDIRAVINKSIGIVIERINADIALVVIEERRATEIHSQIYLSVRIIILTVLTLGAVENFGTIGSWDRESCEDTVLDRRNGDIGVGIDVRIERNDLRVLAHPDHMQERSLIGAGLMRRKHCGFGIDAENIEIRKGGGAPSLLLCKSNAARSGNTAAYACVAMVVGAVCESKGRIGGGIQRDVRELRQRRAAVELCSGAGFYTE